MQYRIHHLDLVGPYQQQTHFEEEIVKRLPRLEKIFESSSTKPLLHIFIKSPEAGRYSVFASIQWQGKDVLVKEEGDELDEVANAIVDKLVFKAEKLVQ
ncbi:MAG: hypothetical protein U0T68_04190 [Ferruginibacter sp.]